MSDNQKKISYLGIPGSYSHQACMEYFPGGHYNGLKNFNNVLKAVAQGDDVDYAIIPVENSSAGRVTEVYNLLPSIGLHIIDEYLLPIHHCLVVPKASFRGRLPREMDTAEALQWKNSPISEKEKAQAFTLIKEVRSHPQALMQCAGFIEKTLPQANTTTDFDTATAAHFISSRVDCNIAAISSEHAASIYDLLVLAKNIEDDPNNMTRFLIMSREPVDLSTVKGPGLTTILFQTGHKPGALLSALKAFADNKVNLTKLETYMVSQELPYPTFYVDVGALLSSPNMQSAMNEFIPHTSNYRILGSYPASPDRGKRNSFLPVD